MTCRLVVLVSVPSFKSFEPVVGKLIRAKKLKRFVLPYIENELVGIQLPSSMAALYQNMEVF